MRRRARETFVLGAERLFDEAELDLRNEAEADHEPNSEPDQTAPAEPAILLREEAAGAPAGAGDWRAKRSASARPPWRPRPPLAAVALGGAAGLAAVALLFRVGDDGKRGGPPVSGARGPAASAAMPDAGGRRDPAGEGDRIEDPSAAPARAGRRDAGMTPDDRTSPRELAPPTVSGAKPEYPEPPAPQPASPIAHGPSAPATTPAAPSQVAEPVHSAAAVRQEFGP